MRSKRSTKKAKRSQPVKGRIGIFWWHNGRVLAVRATPRWEQDVDMRFFHQNIWPAMQYQHPELASLRFDELPQGRVWFMRHGRRFWVQMDRQLFKPTIQAAVLKAFGLLKKATDFGVLVRPRVQASSW